MSTSRQLSNAMFSSQWLSQPSFKNAYPLELYAGTNFMGQGSCVMLNGNIALTAAHCCTLKDFKQCEVEICVPKYDETGKVTIYNRYRVHKIYTPLSYTNQLNYFGDYRKDDIAVLSFLDPVPNVTPLSLDAKSDTNSDSKYTTVGYRSGKLAILPQVLINNTLTTSLETSAAFFGHIGGGMSGGGVFDNSALIGIQANCSYLADVSLFVPLSLHRDWLNKTITQARDDLHNHDIKKEITPVIPQKPIPEKISKDEKSLPMEPVDQVSNLIALVRNILIGSSEVRQFWLDQNWSPLASFKPQVPTGIYRMVQTILKTFACPITNEAILKQWKKDATLARKEKGWFWDKPFKLYSETYAFYACFLELDGINSDKINDAYAKLLAWINKFGNSQMKALIQQEFIGWYKPFSKLLHVQ